MGVQNPPPPPPPRDRDDDHRDDHDHHDDHGSSSHGLPTSDLIHPPTTKPAIPDPERIGLYRIVRRIGDRGGMGLVYLGQREDDQFKKRVAIKVIKPGMDSEAILRRFEQERQVLAALNHPNIARFLDGGSTADGRPYFVMEYIEGQAITEYCDKNRLKIEERLDLFNTLCKAVHHAHQNLVVHRDIKPGNVVVTKEGDVKLLDFGIAKLLNPEMSMFAGDPTATEIRVMTPEYASPEQVRGDPITTASDVYSLGVLLYELLTGRRPYRIRTRVQKEIERVVCEEDPERPSTAITHAEDIPIDEHALTSDVVETTSATPTGTTIEEVAKKRVLKPDRLRRRLAGDIDNIVLMAMRKEPRRRYTSAEQFSEDIKRHLHGDPVIARPATALYRMGKFVQRNKGFAAAMAIVAISLTVGFSVAMVQWQRAEAQTIVAERAERAAVEQRDAVVRLRNLAREFPAEILDSFDEEIKNTPGALAVRELMVKHATNYLQSLEKENPSDPDVMFDIALGYVRIGDIQGGLRSANRGDADAAKRSYEKSQTMWKQVIATNPANVRAKQELAYCQIKLADLVRDSEPVAAMSVYESVQRDMESLLIAKLDDPETLRQLAIALVSQSDILRRDKKFDQAEKLIERTLALRQEVHRLRPDDARAEREIGVALSRKAVLLDDQKRYKESLIIYRKHLDHRQRMFDADPANTQRQRDLMYANFYVARTQHLLEEKDAARICYEKASDLATQLWNSEIQANTRARNEFCAMTVALCSIQLDSNPEKALESAKRAFSYVEISDPDDKVAQERKAQALRMQTFALKKLGRIGEARKSAADASAILATLDPQKSSVKTEIDSMNAIQKELDQLPQASTQ